MDKLLIDVEAAERRLRELRSDTEAEAAKGPLRDVVSDRELLSAVRDSMAGRAKTYYRASPKQVDISCGSPLTPTLSPKGRGNSSFSERQARHERISNESRKCLSF